jgi:indolepyruvate ferredoxin oxidoreductase beta subunit
MSITTPTGGIVKLASLAVGGQGGGVLNDWIIDLAERNGYDVQATSVAGVAQRTGSTLYYVEMMPHSGRRPVFALAPSEDDVDILLAAELMEAGRAVTRRFVTPGRTRVIASTHRLLSTQEKTVPGDGSADGGAVLEALGGLGGDLIAFDMKDIADQEGTVISAALFGALAGSGALPFAPESFRETVRASGRGVAANLAAFERACAIAQGRPEKTAADAPAKPAGPAGPAHLLRDWAALDARVDRLPPAAREVARVGLAKVVSFQDTRYGADYLDRLEGLAAQDEAAGGAGQDHAFTATAAKYLANAMAYDDIIRVADAKTARTRIGRIEAEMGAGAAHLLRVTEYTHPGAAEIVSLMPARIGQWVECRPRAVRLIDRLFNRGRHIRTDRIGGFASLYLAAGLRRWRRSLLRHGREIAHIDAWLGAAQARLGHDYALAVQTLRVRRLIKGYSDTHARGLSKFDRVMAGAAAVDGREDAADWTRRLIDAALKDPEGTALDGALKTIGSFVAGPAPG